MERMMQPPRQSNSIAAVIAAVALGSAILGAICGAFLTYSVMSVGRFSSAATQVPQDPRFGHPAHQSLADGWTKYTFPDLRLSAELPCPVAPYRRTFPTWSTWNVAKTADYSGFGPERIGIGAYWYKTPSYENVVQIMKYNAERPGPSKMKYTIDSTKVDGADAAILHGSYEESGREAGCWMVYISHDQALYNVQLTYWAQDEAKARGDWARILGSLHFLK